MDKEFGWAFIGCGAIANIVAKQLSAISRGKIVAVWNRTRSRAASFAEKFGGTVYDTPEQAVKADGVICVYVATTHDMHAHFSKMAIELGVPVLCEKPLVVNFAQANDLISSARSSGVYLAEAMWTWHNPISLAVKRWVRDGRIGNIKSVRCALAYPLLYTCDNPRVTSPELIGGALMDMGVYSVRYIYELFGMPQNINAHGELLGGVDIDENIVMAYGGFNAELYVSVKTERPEELIIEGSDGTIVVPEFHAARTASLVAATAETVTDNSALYGLQFLHTMQDITGGKRESELVTLHSTLDVMRLLDECRKQMGVVYPCELCG